MKVTLMMATAANGYIAKENDETPWSDAEFKSFHAFVKKRKNIIVGRRTYELMKSANDFKECGNPFVVVMANHPRDLSKEMNVQYSASPMDALEIMKAKGFKEVLLGGGSYTNATFLREGLIDEIIIDIEPFIFGKGIKLFAESQQELKLELIKTEKLSKDTIRLHYNVIKKPKKK